MQWIAAPLASVFLILGLCSFAIRLPASVGVRIPVMRLPHLSPGEWREFECARILLVQLQGNGSLMLNQDPISFDALAPTLAEIMSNRAEPAVYLMVDPNVSYAQFSAVLDRIHGSVSGLHIAVVTRGLRRESGTTPVGVCSLEWPKEEFDLPKR